MVKRSQISITEHSDTMIDNCLAYEAFLEKARKLIPGIDIDRSVSGFQKEKITFHSALARFTKAVKETTLLAAFLDWIHDKSPDDLVVENAQILMENGLIQFTDDAKRPVKLGDLLHMKLNIQRQIEVIRCQRKYSISDRERLVEAFLDFFKWLSHQTSSYTPKFEDPDKEKTENRLLDHDTFVSLLDSLDDRCRVIAKLLYFEGSKSLDQVVKLQVEDVDFKKGKIEIQGQWIIYPLHVFDDLKFLIGKRSSGPIFLGRNDTSINPSTIFRNFKEVSTILGLPEMSPKSLTANK